MKPINPPAMATLVSAFCVLLVGAMTLLSACGGGEPAVDPANAPKSLEMKVLQVDQRSRLGSKLAEGQYIVARIYIKNISDQSLVMNPTEFTLQRATDDPNKVISQPIERFMTTDFVADYGKDLSERVLDFNSVNVHPGLEVERYAVFLVPGKARLKDYQINYSPGGGGMLPGQTGGTATGPVNTPLVGEETKINDLRDTNLDE